jgi:hypothetical protein
VGVVFIVRDSTQQILQEDNLNLSLGVKMTRILYWVPTFGEVCLKWCIYSVYRSWHFEDQQILIVQKPVPWSPVMQFEFFRRISQTLLFYTNLP